eukprot:147973-Amphidinium_carterae.1
MLASAYSSAPPSSLSAAGASLVAIAPQLFSPLQPQIAMPSPRTAGRASWLSSGLSATAALRI